MIKDLKLPDIPLAARLHYQTLDGLLSQLGLTFLEKYYTCSLLIPQMWTIVEKKNDHIIGLVSATTKVKGLNKRIILKDIRGFIVLFLNIFITHPQLIIKTIKTFTYPGFSGDIPELLTMIVDKKYQKKGIGRKLFDKCAEEFKKRGIKKFRISAYDKLPANGFYLHLGCRKEKDFQFLGEKMNYYTYETK